MSTRARTLLTWVVEIQATATRAQISYLASKTECPPEKKRLEQLADPHQEEYTDYVLKSKRTVLELLEEFKSVTLTFADYLAITPNLRPRFYSISSSSKAHPDSVHLTVGVVRGKTPTGRLHIGACSDYLANLKPGDPIRVFIKDTKTAFRLPKDPSVDVIMIGPGTGFAPMRGFLQDRQATEAKEKGSNTLLFGCRSDIDYIYKDEIENWQKDGTLTNLLVAFSRKQASKVYVQDKLAQSGELIWKLIQHGAYVYVCGDARNMAKDVKKTFLEIVKQNGHLNDTLAEEYLQQLSYSKRYNEDVWAS